jgi:cystathionine beta-lyase
MDFIRRRSNSAKWDLAAEDVLPMWVADMDFPAAGEIIDALHRRLDHGFFGYGLVPDGFFDSFIGWARERQGWNPERSSLVYSPSVMTAVRQAVEVFSEPGAGVIVPSPVYFPFFSSVRDKGRTLVESPLIHNAADPLGWHFDFDLLEQQASDPANSILLLCNPHNPAGRVWHRNELDRIVDICINNEVFIISDEIHADIVYEPARFTPVVPLLEAAGAPSGGMAVQAPGKTFNIPGVFSSIIIAPDESVRRRMERSFESIAVDTPNVLSMTAAEAAYRSGGAWLDSTLEVLRTNRDLVDNRIRRLGFTAASGAPEGTYLSWLDIRALEQSAGLSSKEAFRSLKHDGKLWLSPGYMFADEAGRHNAAGFLRLNFACPPEILEEGIRRLENWVDTLQP